MRKLLVAGVLGALVMVTGMGTQAASAAAWRGGYRGNYGGHFGGHSVGRTVYRHDFVRPHVYRGYVDRFYDRCW